MTEITAQERAALAQIETLEDPAKLQAMISNARRLKSSVVETAAFQRLCYVQPEATPGTVEHDVWQSIHAVEQMLLEERGKTVRLSRTRQKIARHGEAKTVADLTLRNEPADGFQMLLDRGHPEMAFETVVLKHPKTFDQLTFEAAENRLQTAGIDPQPFIHQGREAADG